MKAFYCQITMSILLCTLHTPLLVACDSPRSNAVKKKFIVALPFEEAPRLVEALYKTLDKSPEKQEKKTLISSLKYAPMTIQFSMQELMEKDLAKEYFSTNELNINLDLITYIIENSNLTFPTLSLSTISSDATTIRFELFMYSTEINERIQGRIQRAFGKSAKLLVASSLAIKSSKQTINSTDFLKHYEAAAVTQKKSPIIVREKKKNDSKKGSDS